jgi:hypothetical protein
VVSATGFCGCFGAAGFLRTTRFGSFLAVVLRTIRLTAFPRAVVPRLLPLRPLSAVFLRADPRRLRFAMTNFSRRYNNTTKKRVPILRFNLPYRQ